MPSQTLVSYGVLPPRSHYSSPGKVGPWPQALIAYPYIQSAGYVILQPKIADEMFSVLLSALAKESKISLQRVSTLLDYKKIYHHHYHRPILLS